jgi:hypothetical protein
MTHSEFDGHIHYISEQEFQPSINEKELNIQSQMKEGI